MLTSEDRLELLLMPAVRALIPGQDLDRRKRIDYAIADDGKIRDEALSLSASGQPWTLDWVDSGTVAVSLLLPSYFVPQAYELREIHAYVATAPAGSSIIVDAETHDNDTLVTVTIPDGMNYGSTTGVQISIAPATWIRADVQQVGSGTPGSNMTVVAVLYPVEG